MVWNDAYNGESHPGPQNFDGMGMQTGETTERNYHEPSSPVRRGSGGENISQWITYTVTSSLACGTTSQAPFWKYIQGQQTPRGSPIYATQSRYKSRIYRWRENNLVKINKHITRNPSATVEIFNKTTDYNEHHNLNETHKETAVRLQSNLDVFLRNQESLRDPVKVDTEANIEAMKALGYIQ